MAKKLTKEQRLSRFRKCSNEEQMKYIKKRDKEGKGVRRKDFVGIANKCAKKAGLKLS